MLPQRPAAGNSPDQNRAAFHGAACRGTVQTGVAATLAALWDLPPARWIDAGLQVCKQSTVRTVLRGELGPAGARLPIHAKLFRAGRLSDRARDAARGPRGQREFAHLELLRDLGLPAVEPLAAGVAEGGVSSASFLITRTVAAARPFGLGADAETLGRVAALLRDLHDRGIDLPDLHPGNVVVDGGGQPWLLDVTALRRPGVVTTHDRARALAFLCQELDAGALDPRAADLLGGYLAAGPALPADLGRRLAQATRRLRLRGLTSFGRRATRPCRHTEVPERRRGEPRWYLHCSGDPDQDGRLRRRAIEFAAAPPEPLKRGRRGAVWLLDELAVKQREPAAARRLFRAAYLCRFAGVPCAEPVALRLHRGVGLVFAARAGEHDLRTALADGHLDPHQLRQAARSLGDSLGRLHAHGLRHRDLKFDNLVWQPERRTAVIVDLDGLRAGRPSDRRGQGQDLGRVLAAWRGAGTAGGPPVLRAFVGGYLRARRALLRPVRHGRHLWRQAERRARAWASAHRQDDAGPA